MTGTSGNHQGNSNCHRDGAVDQAKATHRHFGAAPPAELLDAPNLESVLRADYGQPAPYCLLLRPESPYGCGPLDLAIKTAFIEVARLDCTGYLLAHEAHHRRQVFMLAHRFGFPLPAEVMSGIWNWEKLWKECGWPGGPGHGS